MTNPMINGQLPCQQCKKYKAIESYDRTKRKACITRGGYSHLCKSCNRDNSYQKRLAKMQKEDILLEIKRMQEKISLAYAIL